MTVGERRDHHADFGCDGRGERERERDCAMPRLSSSSFSSQPLMFPRYWEKKCF